MTFERKIPQNLHQFTDKTLTTHKPTLRPLPNTQLCNKLSSISQWIVIEREQRGKKLISDHPNARENVCERENLTEKLLNSQKTDFARAETLNSWLF